LQKPNSMDNISSQANAGSCPSGIFKHACPGSVCVRLWPDCRLSCHDLVINFVSVPIYVEKTNSYVKTRFFPGFCRCAAVLQAQVPKLCKALDLSLLYILILGTYSKFARKNNFLALGVCFPQPCSSAGRRFAGSRSRVQNYRRIVSFPHQKFR